MTIFRGVMKGGLRSMGAGAFLFLIASAAFFVRADVSCDPPGQETVPAFVQDLKHHDSGRRMRAAFTLGTMKVEEALPALLEGMKDKHLRVRLLCGEAVAKIGVEAFTEELTAFAAEAVETLLLGEDIGARPHAAAFLGAARIGGTQTALLAALRDRENQNVNIRATCAEALGNFRGRDVEAGLASALSDPHFTVRLSAVRAFERIGGPGAAEAIRPLLADSSEHVRERVSHALAAWPSSTHQPLPSAGGTSGNGGRSQ